MSANNHAMADQHNITPGQTLRDVASSLFLGEYHSPLYRRFDESDAIPQYKLSGAGLKCAEF
jgi:hypothetical protein